MPASAVRDEDEAAVDFMDRVEYAVVDFPDNSIVAGAPARLIRTIEDDTE